jgi:hypothetical protein
LFAKIPFCGVISTVYVEVSAMWPAIDNPGQIWTVQIAEADGSKVTFAFKQLSGQAVGSTIGSVKNAAAALASETAGARIYATDENDLLWILRHRGGC